MVKQGIQLSCLVMLAACGDGLVDGAYPAPSADAPGAAAAAPADAAGSQRCADLGGPLTMDAPLRAAGAAYTLQLTRQGHPMLAWGSADAHLAAWDGSAWKAWPTLPRTGALGTPTSHVSLALDALDTPFLGWLTRSTETRLVVQTWAAGAWAGVDGAGVGIALTPGAAQATTLALAVRGSVVMAAWPQLNELALDTGPGLMASRGAGWAASELAAVGVYAPGMTAISLALDAGQQPVLAFNGAAAGVAQVLPATPGALFLSAPVNGAAEALTEPVAMALRADDRPVVAWIGPQSRGAVLRLAAWTGLAWEPFGDSAGEQGLSAGAMARHPAVALDARGYPWVVWEDVASQHIFLRRWDGASWQEVAGSATGAGIPLAASDPAWPQIRITPDNRAVVSWQEGSDTLRVCAF